ncbi:MAG TPA: DUF302 domain-containing protein [Gammaproteobacteria bacterium]|nr:DUF302 domain-containing protein [Gammaproteobacteria bacterium]
MYYTATTAKTVPEAAADLEAAARKRGFGVLHSYDLGSTLASKGAPIDKDVRVLDVCNPQRARDVLSADASVSVALPCRIAVYDDGSRTSIGMLRPGALLAQLSSDERLAVIAEDVEATLKAAIDEAAEAGGRSPPGVEPGASGGKTLDSVAEGRLRLRDAELRADIDRELRAYRAERGVAAANVPDSAELSAAALIAEVKLAEVDRDFSELLEVESALQRLGAGTYGICVDCGDAVELRRLEKRPHAARCKRCQTAAERAGGRRRPPKL